jgi:hypothetical protein
LAAFFAIPLRRLADIPSARALTGANLATLDGIGVNLSDKTRLSALFTQVAQTERITLGQGVADTMRGFAGDADW